MSSNSSQHLQTPILGSEIIIIKKNLVSTSLGATPKRNQTNWKKGCTNCGRGKEPANPLWYERPWTSAEWQATAVILGLGSCRSGRGHSRLCAASLRYYTGCVGGGGSSWSSPRHCVSLIDLIGSRHQSVLNGTWLHLTCPEKSWWLVRINGHWASYLGSIVGLLFSRESREFFLRGPAKEKNNN